MSYIAYSYLSLNEAAEMAAKENHDRDCRYGLERGHWEITSQDTREMYLEEAEDLLTEVGANFLPDYSFHHSIIIAK